MSSGRTLEELSEEERQAFLNGPFREFLEREAETPERDQEGKSFIVFNLGGRASSKDSKKEDTPASSSEKDSQS